LFIQLRYTLNSLVAFSECPFDIRN